MINPNLDLFNEDIRKIITELPIKRLNKENKTTKQKALKKISLKNIIKEGTKGFVVKSTSISLHFFWFDRSIIEKVAITSWIILNLIVIFLSLSQNIDINVRLCIVIIYAAYSFITLIILELSLIFGSYQREKSRDSGIKSIVNQSLDFYERSLKILRINLVFQENSIRAAQEIFQRKLDREKYIEKRVLKISIISSVFLISFLYLFYGNSILDFFKLWNLPSKEALSNGAKNSQALGNSINIIFQGTLFPSVIFIFKTLLSSSIRSEVIILQSCISVFEYAKSLYEEENPKINK